MTVVHDAELMTVGPDEAVVTFRTDGDDFVALDNNHGVLDGLPARRVEHARGAQREQGGARLRRRVLRARAGWEREKKKKRE